jgi:hypothetical protein
MEPKPVRFISEPIDAHYDSPPLLEKKPGCPDGFKWRGEEFRVVDMLNEWHDYQRRGRMARNMQPAHAQAASRRGSWGVGLDYYRVVTSSGQIFDIYFDRSPKSSDDRKGEWFLYQELAYQEE